jgi:hypothetical protein
MAGLLCFARLHIDGQGEIRTLDTGFTGMPVFETGAFNHSATCPAVEKYRVANGATTAK